MKLDPKDVANVDPFEKGRALIEKDDVKAKRDRKKEQHERQCNMAAMCYEDTLRRRRELQSQGEIDLHPRSDQHEAIREYATEYSPWENT